MIHHLLLTIFIDSRILDEISEVLGEREFVTATDIEQLQYMEQVCGFIKNYVSSAYLFQMDI